MNMNYDVVQEVTMKWQRKTSGANWEELDADRLDAVQRPADACYWTRVMQWKKYLKKAQNVQKCHTSTKKK